MGDRIAVFNKGRIEQLGAPMALYRRPANAFVAGFLGAPRINLIGRPGAEATGAHRALWSLLGGHDRPAAQQLGLRPEHLRLAPAGGQGVPARVVLAEHLGDVSIVHLRVEGLAELPCAKLSDADARQAGADGGLAPGHDVMLQADPADVLAFDTDTHLLG